MPWVLGPVFVPPIPHKLQMDVTIGIATNGVTLCFSLNRLLVSKWPPYAGGHGALGPLLQLDDAIEFAMKFCAEKWCHTLFTSINVQVS